MSEDLEFAYLLAPVDRALHAYRATAAAYQREITAIRERFLVGRLDDETFTVGELRALFRDGPA